MIFVANWKRPFEKYSNVFKILSINLKILPKISSMLVFGCKIKSSLGFFSFFFLFSFLIWGFGCLTGSMICSVFCWSSSCSIKGSSIVSISSILIFCFFLDFLGVASVDELEVFDSSGIRVGGSGSAGASSMGVSDRWTSSWIFWNSN